MEISYAIIASTLFITIFILLDNRKDIMQKIILLQLVSNAVWNEKFCAIAECTGRDKTELYDLQVDCNYKNNAYFSLQ